MNQQDIDVAISVQGFNEGWNAAVEGIRQAVATYRQQPEPKDAWEEWLPRYLSELTK